MRKYLTLILSVAVFAPYVAFAAYNDVTLTTDALIGVAGYTLNITGSSAAIQSIVVNDSNFQVSISSGSSIQITSPTQQELSVDISSFTTSNVCVTGTSVLTLASSGASGTVTVTPSSTVCTTPASSNSVAIGNGPIVGSIVGSGFYRPASSSGVSVQAQATSSVSVAKDKKQQFSKDLFLGKTDPEVLELQRFLNNNGFVVSVSGMGSKGGETTYFGAATRAALIRFQKARKISPAQGYFGSVTRKALK
ncbi:MAG: peptidoglycan-binding domain-containing protein [bacterium]